MSSEIARMYQTTDRTNHMKTSHALCFATLAILTTIASAHDTPLTYDRVNLSASAAMEVEQDELRATLYALNEGENAGKTADAVSRDMQQALQIVHRLKGITAQTGNFSTQPVYRKQRISGWRSRQNLSLKSTDSRALSELVGKLQQYLSVQNINYQVSDEKRQIAEDELTKKAIKNFKDRAQLITSNLGKRNYRLVNMNVSSNSPHQPPVVMRAMAMENKSIAPQIQAGTQRIQININGTIEIQIE
ncbi:MAG: DUF541 domain-containing protein [Gammaproteobacteria bacterium]|nr:MAG: DUF541 domain-containing protein [Gammaproteobacteria bacterium]